MPELFKKPDKKSRKKGEKKIYVCSIGRTGFEGIVYNLIQDGYSLTEHQPSGNLSRDEVTEWYEKRRSTVEREIPDVSFAIVRHPISRIESHVKFSLYKKMLQKNEEELFDFIDHSLDNLFEENLGKNIIPSFDSALFDATVFQYEIGMRKIADYFVENKIVKKWTKLINVKDEENVRISWGKCPVSIKDKILRIYEQDFEQFEYDPDDFFKM